MGHNGFRCWCGNTQLEPFSVEYLRCLACESLVLMQWPAELVPKSGDEQAYYGKEYWLSHQEHDLKLPNILNRARTDLVDRVPYWLEKVLQHRLPPARALELGCANGSLVAMLRQLGYDASGLELSEWVVDFARQTFNIPMYLGPIEEQAIAPHSLDLLILMDVIEHLPDPLETMRNALRALRPGGLVILQTPEYPAGKSFSELSAGNHPFLNMMIPGEHLHLFSRSALKQLLLACGLEFTLEEPALFPYDQFLFASSAPIASHTPAETLASLEEKPERRLVLAQLDLYQNLTQMEQLYVQADLDRRTRLERMNELSLLLATAEADRTARLERMNELSLLLATAEADRTARLAVIETLESQVKELDLENNALSRQMDEYRHALSQYQRRFHLWESIAGKTIKPANLTAQQAEKTTAALKRMVIDLTPVRPGGENGGAKLLALELVKRFSRDIAPNVEFILLTSSNTHEELAWLDRPNVRRMCVNSVHAEMPTTPNTAQPTLQRPLLRKVTHRIAQILEDVLPKETYRKVYQRFNQKVNLPKNANLVRSLGADLVFCPFTGISYHSPEIPMVVAVHDLQYIYYPEFFTADQLYHSDRNFREICNMADRIICLSDFSRESVLKFGKVEPQRVTTLHASLFNPIMQQPEARVTQVTAALQLTPGKYLFYPANFWPHKNHAMLLTAFNMYQHQHPGSDLKLVFTGAPGSSMDNLRQAAQRMRLEDKLLFAGFLKEDEFAALLQGCLALIFPSLFEGFGVPVLEAMRFGKPVLCSKLTSLPEVCGEAALYFDARRPDDIMRAIEKIVNEPNLASELVQRGKQQATRFDDLDGWARHYFQIFTEVFQGERVYHNGLTGLYGDHWAGHSLEISVAGGVTQELEIEFSPPPWLPKDLTVQLNGAIPDSQKTHTIPRGEKRMLRIPLSERGGMIEIHFSPAIAPAALNMSADQRPLTCMVKICRLISSTGNVDLISGGSH